MAIAIPSQAADARLPLEPTAKRSPVRWAIAVMLFFAAILNYIDRQILAILAPTIQKDLGLTDRHYGDIANLFFIAYTLATIGSGWLIDRLGTRVSMAIFVTWWSVSNIATGWARSFGTLAGCRFFLGLGEAGNWPGSAKSVGEWFSAKERGFAIGLYTMGATLGATIAPVLILWIVFGGGGSQAGEPVRHWQWAFAATGAAGLLWVVPWLILSGRPKFVGTPAATPGAPPADASEPAATRVLPYAAAEPKAGWRAVLSNRDVWFLMVGRMLTDPVWFFYQVWFAKYLFSERGVKQEDLGVTWVIFLAADFGSLLGGLASGLFIRRGVGAVKSRLIVMLLCAAVMPVSLMIPTVPGVWLALAIAMVCVFAHLSWLVNMTALIVDAIPARMLATAFGVIAAGSGLSAFLMNKVVVYFIENYSYAKWFLVAAVLHPAAWALLWVWNRTRRAAAEPA